MTQNGSHTASIPHTAACRFHMLNFKKSRNEKALVPDLSQSWLDVFMYPTSNETRWYSSESSLCT